MVPAAKYLAGAALSRPLYQLLFKEAVGMLPPADPKVTAPENLECCLPLRDLAEVLGHSYSVVKRDMRRLQNYGWVERFRGTPITLLGRRRGVRYTLIADVSAERATGDRKLISKVVLGLPSAETRAEQAATGRGINRRWRPDGSEEEAYSGSDYRPVGRARPVGEHPRPGLHPGSVPARDH